MEARFQIQEKIGEGGAGSVYKAFDATLGRIVAIKKIRGQWDSGDLAEISGSQATPEALLREARLISSLQHPNVITIHDVGQDESGPFLVMEYLTGDTLSDVVEKAPLLIADFFAVAEQSLEGLAAVHGLDMLHRDLKPSNLMLVWDQSENYRVKLLDFGLAKISQAPAMQTVDQEGSLIGSIHFMAPEQFERSPLDVRTDLYSLGCVLYFALTQRYPFDGETAAQVMAGHLRGAKVDVRQLRPDLSEALAEWLEKLLARDRAIRFSSAKESLAALREIRRGLTVSLSSEIRPLAAVTFTGNHVYPTVRQISPTFPAVKPIHRTKPILFGTLAIACAATLGGLGYFFKDTMFPASPAAEASGGKVTEKVYSPLEIQSIREKEGQEITLTGKIIRAGESKSGKTRYLNFSWPPGETIPLAFSSEETGITLKELKAFEGRDITARGKVEIIYGQTYVMVSSLETVVSN